jgi:polyhydroxyalkanoate synthesis regulator phasin
MKTLKEEAEHYSECHQDVSEELGKYLVSAVFQDGANSKWVQAEKIRAQIDILEQLWSRKGMIDELRTELEQQLKQLENESKTDTPR